MMIKILVVEDSQIVRAAYVSYLKRYRFQVDCAADGLQALAMAVNKYHVILMDVYLPHINGIDVTFKLRQQSNIGDPVIIGITSDAEPARHQMCLDAGMNEVLQKPLESKHILAVINKYLKR